MLDRLHQAVEEGVHQGTSLPAAVGSQFLEIYGEIRHCVLALAETQQLSTGLQAGGRAVKHALHLHHELPRRSQAPPVGVPLRRPPASRSPGQLGDDVRYTRGVGGEGLGLKVEDELTLRQERSTTSRRPVVPLRGRESRLPDPGHHRTVQAAPRTGALWDRSDPGSRDGTGCLEGGRQCGDLV